MSVPWYYPHKISDDERSNRPTDPTTPASQSVSLSLSQSSDVYLEVLTIVLARDLEGRALPHLHAVALREACGV